MDGDQPADKYREDPASLVVSCKLKVSKWQEAPVLHYGNHGLPLLGAYYKPVTSPVICSDLILTLTSREGLLLSPSHR